MITGFFDLPWTYLGFGSSPWSSVTLHSHHHFGTQDFLFNPLDTFLTNTLHTSANIICHAKLLYTLILLCFPSMTKGPLG